MFEITDYSIFFEFIKKYSGYGFQGINNQEHFMVRLNMVLERGRQFFYVADIPRFQLLYTSPQVLDIYGIEPEKFDLSYNFFNTHPLEIQRRSRARVNVIEAGQELFLKKSGAVVISSNFWVKTFIGEYIPVLVQNYLFYCSSPVNTVYILQINTPIERFSKIIKRNQYHWFAGTDLSYLRYPDEELVLTGTNLSGRELEVIKCIHKGMGSREIGERMSLSIHTINTHRRNILKKTQKSTIGEVIFELESIGIL
jgi:DNA-binding CsgD family transcriptional regulator